MSINVFGDDASFRPLAAGVQETNVGVGARTVAIFDVLGFRQLIETGPLEQLARQYESLIRQADALNRPLVDARDHPSLFPDHPVGQPWCLTHVFSDTVVMISDDSTPDSCRRLLVASWRLFQVFLAAGFPLRGAIAHGDMCVNRAMRVFVGPALVDAHTLETRQQWVGAAVDPSVTQAHPELEEDMRSPDDVLSCLFTPYDVPMKDGTRVRLPALNWRFNLVVKNGTRSLFLPTNEESAREKQMNALAYAQSVVESRRLYVQGTGPREIPVLSVGDSEPPFPHGDEL